MLNDLPDSIRRMEIIHADLAALALTGLIKAGTVNNAEQRNYDGWETAMVYKNAIINAVRNSSLQAHSVTVERENGPIIISSKGLYNNDLVLDVEVYSKELWTWFYKPSQSSISSDPLAELNNYKAEFVSLKEIFDIFKSKHPHMTANQIAEWMVRKFCYESEVQVYTQGIAGKLYQCGNEYYEDDNPFLLSLLERVINDGEEAFAPQSAIKEIANPPFDFEDDIPF